jgi:hypothetical protein
MEADRSNADRQRHEDVHGGDGVPADRGGCLLARYAGTPPVEAWADPSHGWAAGGAVSTPTTPEQGQHGLGAFVESDGEQTIVGHTGGIAGWLSYAYYLEQPAVALIVLSSWEGTEKTHRRFRKTLGSFRKMRVREDADLAQSARSRNVSIRHGFDSSERLSEWRVERLV